MGKILLVEDNEIICDCLKNIIATVDASQNIYSTGYAALALEHAQNNPVDVFLLDIELLDYSGIQLAEQIREIEEYKMTPIVFITNDYKLELEAFRNTQCYKFIAKPFRTEEVKETIQTVLQHGMVKNESDEKLFLKQKGYTVSVFQKDLIYIEVKGRKLLAVTRQENIEICTYTLSGLAEELTKDFFQCHKGFVVNSNWIYSVDKSKQVIHLRENRGSIPFGDRYKDHLEGVWI